MSELSKNSKLAIVGIASTLVSFAIFAYLTKDYANSAVMCFTATYPIAVYWLANTLISRP